MLSEFSPMFERDNISSATEFSSVHESAGIIPEMSDTGVFIDTQVHVRNLKVANIINMFRSIRRKNYSS